MKSYYSSLVCLLIAACMTACAYDNYDQPDCYLTGHVTYAGKPFVFDGNVSVLKAIQKGFGKNDPGMSIRINEDGTYSQLFFAGDYYLTLANQQYPFQFADFHSLGAGLGYDTIPIRLSGSMSRDFEVIPYYLMDSIVYDPLDSSSTELKVSVRIRRNPDAQLPDTLPEVTRAFLFVGINQHVNSATTLTKASRPLHIDNEEVVTMRLDLSKYRNPTYYVNNYRDYLYFRIGIELDATYVASGYYLFSELYRVDNVPL
ncbi:MAG: DUF3823 domain-containing protein [Paludibacteraceae bacterium]|nr:DUF3823 domain-containing protein [Paludibacteraceae bacterium]